MGQLWQDGQSGPCWAGHLCLGTAEPSCTVCVLARAGDQPEFYWEAPPYSWCCGAYRQHYLGLLHILIIRSNNGTSVVASLHLDPAAALGTGQSCPGKAGQGRLGMTFKRITSQGCAVAAAGLVRDGQPCACARVASLQLRQPDCRMVQSLTEWTARVAQ